MTEITNPKLVRPKVNKILILTIFFIVLNIGLSIFLTYDFYTQGQSTVCSIDNFLSCGGVAESKYVLLFNVPHALLGIVFYTILLIGIGGVLLRVSFHRIIKFLRPQTVLDLLRWASYVAVLYGFYLTYSEISVLKIYSAPYIVQQLLIFIIAGLQIWANTVIHEGKEETQVCEFC
ncbi:vitamin K epoxide reductase family protein [bacterium]|nr:vitamin K epoxide reductase family protein [bacterium]